MQRPFQGLLTVQRFVNLRVDLFVAIFVVVFFDCCFLLSSRRVVVLAQCQRLVWNDNQQERSAREGGRERGRDATTGRIRNVALQLRERTRNFYLPRRPTLGSSDRSIDLWPPRYTHDA